jgi:putative redox protein
MTKICDCFPELKDITDAREKRYRAHPEKPAPEGPQSFVEVKVTSIGQLNELVECKKSGFKFVISEPVHVGGQNVAPTPLEFLLSGVVGCYAAVFAFYAAKLGVSYDSFEATARTTMDVRGHMMPDAPPSGFQTVTIDINVVSDAPPETLREIERLSLEGCPGINTLRYPVPVETQLSVTPSSQAAA